MYIYIYTHAYAYVLCLHLHTPVRHRLPRFGKKWYPFCWSLPCRRPEADMDAFRLGAGLRLENLGCTFCLQHLATTIWIHLDVTGKPPNSHWMANKCEDGRRTKVNSRMMARKRLGIGGCLLWERAIWGIGQEDDQTTCALLQSDRLTLPNLQQELKWSFELNGWVLPPLH